MSDDESILQRALNAPSTAIAYTLSEAVTAAFPGRYVLETSDGSFSLDTFAKRVETSLEIRPAPHPQLTTRFRGPDKPLLKQLEQGHRVVRFDGERFDVIEASWSDGYERHWRAFIVGASEAVVDRFAHLVATVANEIRDEVLVFANGCWNRSQELRKAIRGATFDNLVLAEGLSATLLDDFRQFLGARADYERYGVPWKRGVLFVGPPGNGKTHCVKALLNALDLPCLYVQSLEAPYTNPQDNIAKVFERARRTTPCALVLEDLDALVTDTTRSFFLNELDGFAENTGVVTIATTNHPERLDPAILDRPSRFDRKYLFELPGASEREAYLNLWNENLERDVRLSQESIADLSQRTEGFSYAYVKELILSSLMRWMSLGRPQPMSEVARTQIESLRAQMAGAADEDRPKFVRESREK